MELSIGWQNKCLPEGRVALVCTTGPGRWGALPLDMSPGRQGRQVRRRQLPFPMIGICGWLKKETAVYSLGKEWNRKLPHDWRIRKYGVDHSIKWIYKAKNKQVARSQDLGTFEIELVNTFKYLGAHCNINLTCYNRKVWGAIVIPKPHYLRVMARRSSEEIGSRQRCSFSKHAPTSEWSSSKALGLIL